MHSRQVEIGRDIEFTYQHSIGVRPLKLRLPLVKNNNGRAIADPAVLVYSVADILSKPADSE
jgi:hypothetical protein